MPRSYVNNSMNRSLGRVGMPVGSMAVSRSSGGGGSSSSGGGSSGGYAGGGGSSNSSASSGTRTYADNPSNRSLGRVGMPHGSMVVSKDSSPGTSTSTATPRVYTDNSTNRGLGRVGMPLGSAPVSKDTPSSSSGSTTQKVYVDSPENRRLGRVGMPHGTMVVSKDSSKTSPASSSASPKVYVDNTSNKRLGRVGLPYGSCPSTSGRAAATPPRTSPGNCYKDTPLNRKLNRVGKLLGTEKQTKYVDNQLNRILNRVGMEIGTALVTTEDQAMARIQRKLNKEEQSLPDLKDIQLSDMETEEEVFCMQEEQRAETVKKAVERSDIQLFTDMSMFQDGTPIINYSDLNIGGMLGAGATAKVSFAVLRGSAVAVKEMKKKADERVFRKEVMLLGKLNNNNIVKLIAATLTPRCLIMEYVHDNLFKALFVERKGFSDGQKHDVVLGMSQGLEYLHMEHIAHCDIKSMNILLQYSEFGEESNVFQNYHVTAKLADFGLSQFRIDPYELDKGGIFGTLNYMPPEVMLGEKLNRDQRFKADVYSLALVMLELFTEERVFRNTPANKIRQLVCKPDYQHHVPREILDDHVAELLIACLDRDPSARMSSDEVCHQVQYGDQNSSICPS